MKNWAGNLDYSATGVERPSSLAELTETVAAAAKIKPLGSLHCFNDIANTSGTHILLDGLGGRPEIDEARGVVRVPGRTSYGELAQHLHERGYALHNMASLPHISVAGALQTGTHGSGIGNGGLASAVKAIELVRASGEVDRLEESDGDEFFGSVVGLGALGIVTAVELAIEPTYQVSQHVFERLPWAEALENFEEIAASAYSVSLFTDYYEDSIAQVWQKARIDDDGDTGAAPQTFFGATAATIPRHPLPEMSGENCTEQLGVPGPWLERLPHFRPEFTPSNGDELQSEYILPREHAAAALEQLRGLSGRIAPLLYVSEIRTIAADEFWLSPSYRQDSVAFHLTWKPRQSDVEALLPDIESALSPLGARPHWGKLFTAGADQLAPLYPRFNDFRSLVEKHDPTGKFRNSYLDRVLG
ncbi:D-arabinono-1,4-lactone oxidase [Arthrobacter sp. H14]|uniref:D-arabinono-1,4-lactone oxidase n=1 Tax=Arthrobacter sp. H14 TaxID=1312959 RepID=UPI00047BCB8D|nr:D-arabinono-1,4-lactone oxidase [Arthrobacter sp. H14]